MKRSSFLNKKEDSSKSKSGFTVIELLFAVTILIILATIAFKNLEQAGTSTKYASLMQDTTNLRNIASNYYVQNIDNPRPFKFCQNPIYFHDKNGDGVADLFVEGEIENADENTLPPIFNHLHISDGNTLELKCDGYKRFVINGTNIDIKKKTYYTSVNNKIQWKSK